MVQISIYIILNKEINYRPMVEIVALSTATTAGIAAAAIGATGAYFVEDMMFSDKKRRIIAAVIIGAVVGTTVGRFVYPSGI